MSTATDIPHPLPAPLVELIAERFRVLGEPMRIRLLDALREAPATVQELQRATGASQQSVSKHLGVLLRSGLVSRSKEGNFSLYAIADEGVFELVRAGLRRSAPPAGRARLTTARRSQPMSATACTRAAREGNRRRRFSLAARARAVRARRQYDAAQRCAGGAYLSLVSPADGVRRRQPVAVRAPGRVPRLVDLAPPVFAALRPLPAPGGPAREHDHCTALPRCPPGSRSRTTRTSGRSDASDATRPPTSARSSLVGQ